MHWSPPQVATGLGRARARSRDVHPGLPRGWRGPGLGRPLCLPGGISRELERKLRCVVPASQGSSTCCATTPAPGHGFFRGLATWLARASLHGHSSRLLPLGRACRRAGRNVLSWAVRWGSRSPSPLSLFPRGHKCRPRPTLPQTHHRLSSRGSHLALSELAKVTACGPPHTWRRR